MAKEVPTTRDPKRPVFRKDCPKDRAVIATDSTGALVLVIEHIGPGLDELQGLENISDVFLREAPPPGVGVWMWEGEVRISVAPDGQRSSLLEGTYRLLTEDEAKVSQSGDSPWDPDLWYEKEPVWGRNRSRDGDDRSSQTPGEVIEYEAIRSAYGERKAKRSGLPYLRHIDQGLLLLRFLKADDEVLRAWCLHPIFQLDELFVPLMKGDYPAVNPLQASSRILVLAMEYRAVANAFLTHDVDRPGGPRISRIPEVNMMLVADKVQNWRDARLHLYSKIDAEKATSLNRYFLTWLNALGVSFEVRSSLEAILSEDDLWTRRK